MFAQYKAHFIRKDVDKLSTEQSVGLLALDNVYVLWHAWSIAQGHSSVLYITSAKSMKAPNLDHLIKVCGSHHLTSCPILLQYFPLKRIHSIIGLLEDTLKLENQLRISLSASNIFIIFEKGPDKPVNITQINSMYLKFYFF